MIIEDSFGKEIKVDSKTANAMWFTMLKQMISKKWRIKASESEPQRILLIKYWENTDAFD